MPSGKILHLQRLSTEDGPGIRTTVFFKGCPLQCAWCHNPESISRYTQIQWLAVRCLGCGTCVETCPYGCLTLSEDGLLMDRENCQACGACVEACPSGALEALGKTVSIEGLLDELLKDKAYYEQSGGGVTLSGGEPTLQVEFVKTLLQKLTEAGISTALDTCGLTSQRILERLLPYTDLILFDLKLMDNFKHKDYTGQFNSRILENLLFVKEYIQRENASIDLWIRTPLIPGVTDTEENLQRIGGFLSEYVDGTVSRWELCAFNNLCRDQYTRLGLDWDFANTPLMTKEDLARCEQVAKASSSRPEIVLATGATRVSELV